MANYYGLGGDEPVENSERHVAEAFRSLGADWTVIHHVTWQSQRDGRQGDGEADFIVLHPKRGLLVLEVKGGGIDVVNGRWRTTDRYGEIHNIRNPYEQASASKHALVAWLKDIGLLDRVRIGHAVVFPNLNDDEIPPLGLAAPAAITITKCGLSEPEESLGRCMRHWELSANLTASEARRIIDLLAPTVTVRRRLSEASARAEANLIVLTAEQVSAFAGLRCSRGGLVLGGAGTGKTVLAVARAHQLVAEGFKTLLVCYNEILGGELNSRFEKVSDLTAGTYHTLCFNEARRAGLLVPNVRSRDWWESGAPEMLVEACTKTGSSYDAIIVDEAQDFSPVWLDSLRCLTSGRRDAQFFAFADSNQYLAPVLARRNGIPGDV